MAVALTVASWNVEHFGKGSVAGSPADPARLQRVTDKLGQLDPDVMAVYEVSSPVVFDAFTAEFPNHHFSMTEGAGAQEILVGVRKTFGSFFTQRLEFSSRSLVGLRPGALLTVTHGPGEHYSLLFLHTKSIDDPRGFGLRAFQIDKAFNLKKALDRKAVEQTGDADAKANFIFLGDLNSMGLNLTYSNADISAGEEIGRLRRYSAGRGMELLSKTKPHTFWNGPASEIPKSDLDHVVAASHLKFASFGGKQVKVIGWPEKPSDASAAKWIDEHSDHALLFFKVNRAS